MLSALVIAVAVANLGRDRGGFVEEAVPFRQAITLWGWDREPPTLDPRFFSYPSLSIYLHALSQALAIAVGLLTGRYSTVSDAGVEFALDPTWLVTAGRLLGLLALLASALLVASSPTVRDRWLAVLTGTCVVLTPTLVRGVLQMPPEILMTPLLVLAVTGAARATVRGDSIAVAVLAGLLCGLKLSALPCGLLLLWSVRAPSGTQRARPPRLPGLMLITLVVFLLTTPYAVLDAPRFLADTAFEWRHLRTGHLGGTVTGTALAHGRQLFAALGTALPIALVSATVFRLPLPREARLSMLAALAFIAPAAFARSGGPERYIAPAIPLLWLWVRDVAFACRIAPSRAPRIVGAILLLLIVTQMVVMGREVLRPGDRTPAARAGAWVRAEIAPHALVLQEYGAMWVYSEEDRRTLATSRCLAGASPRWTGRFERATPYTIVPVPFVASGEVATRVHVGGAGDVDVTAFRPAWESLPAVYAVAERANARAFVRHRPIADRLGVLYPPLALDRELPQGWTRVEFRPEVGAGSKAGPEVTIELRSANTPPLAALEPGWWKERSVFEVPPALAASLSHSERSSILATARLQVFRERFEPFLLGLARAAIAERDSRTAADMARLVLANDPENLIAVRLAILAISAVDGVALPSRGGDRELRPAPGEAIEHWVPRVLAEWGVSAGLIQQELDRYAEWRRPPPDGVGP